MKLLSYIIVLLFSVNLLSAQISKDEAYKLLQNKYKNISSVQLSFSSDKGPDWSGTIKAKKGNKYQIKMPLMTVISNGKTVWNLNMRDGKVLISDFDKKSKSAFSIDKFFFSFMSDFTAESFSKINKSSGKSYYEMVLKPKSGVNTQFTKFKIHLAKNGQDISYVEFDDNGSTQSFNISNIKINPKLSDKTFEYKAEKGIEVIDLRK